MDQFIPQTFQFEKREIDWKICGQISMVLSYRIAFSEVYFCGRGKWSRREETNVFEVPSVDGSILAAQKNEDTYEMIILVTFQ